MKFEFSIWLAANEASTSTSCIAGFARPLTGMVRRDAFVAWAADDPFFDKREKKKQPKVR